MEEKKNNNTRQPSILDGLINSLSDHAAMVANGVPNEQALRIAFGDDAANAAIETVKRIEEEQK